MKVAKALAPNYAFGIYDVEDIEQEAFIIGMECIERYDPKKASLKTFLYTHINNRLRTLKRDNYIRFKKCPHCDTVCDVCRNSKQKLENKIRFLHPMNIESIPIYVNHYHDYYNSVEIKEIKTIIDKNLPMEYREDYLKMLDEVDIPYNKKKQIEKIIYEIMEENGYI